MFEVKERPKMVERALLVGVYFSHDEKDEAADLLLELEELVTTLGVPIVGRELVYVRERKPKLLMGSGHADRVTEMAKELKADVIVFDNELSPGQQRNWETLSKECVIDRQEVILDIFGKRAQTREARLQVELARAEYSLPRLQRAWTHLGQQGGGIGAKGEGESQLELDRRMIRKHIDKLKADLEEVRKQRATQRKNRQRVPVPNAAIVGYTNAGKSSLLRRLTNADVLVEDKLFATLDTTTRRIDLPNGQPLLLTDTVGFVRKLPHRLVEAFNSTLEESVLANFLIHLLDASHPNVEEFHTTTMEVLAELGADEKRTLTVFNKVDKIEDPHQVQALRLRYPEAHFISVHSGEGLEDLFERMAELLADSTRWVRLMIPHERGDVVARLHRDGKVENAEYLDDGVQVQAIISNRHYSSYEEFEISPDEGEIQSAITDTDQVDVESEAA